MFNDQFNYNFCAYINIDCNENDAAVSITCRIALSLRWNWRPPIFKQPNATYDQSLLHSFFFKECISALPLKSLPSSHLPCSLLICTCPIIAPMLVSAQLRTCRKVIRKKVGGFTSRINQCAVVSIHNSSLAEVKKVWNYCLTVAQQ